MPRTDSLWWKDSENDVEGHAACGVKSPKWANVAIKIFERFCLNVLPPPLFSLAVLPVLHLSPIWRQNLRQTQIFESILMENAVYVEGNIDTLIMWIGTRQDVFCFALSPGIS